VENLKKETITKAVQKMYREVHIHISHNQFLTKMEN